MRDSALELLTRLPVGSAFLPAQVLGELFNLLVRKDGKSPATARKIVSTWQNSYDLIDTSSDVLAMAFDLATDHQVHVWDSIVLSAAAKAQCELLLSEDLQHGFSWRGVTVTNPFAKQKHPLLKGLLNRE
jgi:predicted nucleic acid-binding protein